MRWHVLWAMLAVVAGLAVVVWITDWTAPKSAVNNVHALLFETSCETVGFTRDQCQFLRERPQ